MKRPVFLILLMASAGLASGQQDYKFSFPSPEIRVDTIRPLSAYRLSIIKPLNVTGSLSVKGTRLPSMFMFECVDSINNHRFALTKNGYLISGTHHNPATNVDGLAMMGRGNTLFGADAVAIGKQIVNEADTTMALGYYYTVPETKHNMTIIGYGNNRIEMAADSGRFLGNWKIGSGSGGGELPVATTENLGGIKLGTGLTADADGITSVVNHYNIYVDPINGDDNNDGKTTSTAFKTLIKATGATHATIKPFVTSDQSRITIYVLGSNPVFDTGLNIQNKRHISINYSGILTIDYLTIYNCNYVRFYGGNTNATDGDIIITSTVTSSNSISYCGQVIINGNIKYLSKYPNISESDVRITGGLFYNKPVSPYPDGFEISNSRLEVFGNIVNTTGIIKSQNSIIPTSKYSAGEQATGERWISGKMIYRKTYIINQPASSTNQYINLLVDNIDEVIKFEWLLNKGNMGYQSNFYNSSSDFLTVRIAQNMGGYDHVIYVNNNASQDDVTGYATVYYTCTDR